MKGVGYVGNQHRIYLAPLYIHHAGQRMRKGPEVLGFNAGRVNQADAFVNRRTFLEKRLSAINNHIVTAFYQSRSKLDEKCLSAAICGGYTSSAEDREPQLPSINGIRLSRVYHIRAVFRFTCIHRGIDLIFSLFLWITNKAPDCKLEFIVTTKFRNINESASFWKYAQNIFS